MTMTEQKLLRKLFPDEDLYRIRAKLELAADVCAKVKEFYETTEPRAHNTIGHLEAASEDIELLANDIEEGE